MADLSKNTDRHGNYWPTELHVRSDMSGESFGSEFSGFATIAVEVGGDVIVAAGSSEEALAAGFADKGIDPKTCQLEPGPLEGSLPNLEKILKSE